MVRLLEINLEIVKRGVLVEVKAVERFYAIKFKLLRMVMSSSDEPKTRAGMPRIWWVSSRSDQWPEMGMK